jgi:hypothetical protein
MNFNDSLKYNLCMKPLQIAAITNNYTQIEIVKMRIATIEDILKIQDDLGLREELEFRKAELIQMAVCEFLEDKPEYIEVNGASHTVCIGSRCPHFNDNTCPSTEEE